MARISNVQQLAEWRLCLGCGACAFICPDRKVRLIDFVSEGFRPVLDDNDCGTCTECLQTCPAFENDHSVLNEQPGVLQDVAPYCGPVLEIWEGHATDEDIRFRGASGGILTALSCYCLEQENMHGVLHIGMSSSDPTRNETRMSLSRSEMLANSGSRYSAAAACDSLHLIEAAPTSCVFIGQPSEVTALRKAEKLRPRLREKVGIALSFFCAGSPARRGTLELLKSLGVAPEQIRDLRYRGRGWPGMFAVTLDGEDKPAHQLTYKESWGFVQAYRPFSTHLCPDGTGEDADISCGDPWYRDIPEKEKGLSLVVVRTERGRRLLQDAMKAGYVSLKPAEPWKLLESQKNLIAKRGAIWGRIAALKLLGLPVPRLEGFSLFRNWLRLGLQEKLRSTLGTVRRALKRKYHSPLDLHAMEENEHVEVSQGAKAPQSS